MYMLMFNIMSCCRQRQTDAKLGIEDANQKFYDAFRAGSLKVWCGPVNHRRVPLPAPASASTAKTQMEP
jgi:hypothetical protein